MAPKFNSGPLAVPGHGPAAAKGTATWDKWFTRSNKHTDLLETQRLRGRSRHGPGDDNKMVALSEATAGFVDEGEGLKESLMAHQPAAINLSQFGELSDIIETLVNGQTAPELLLHAKSVAENFKSAYEEEMSSVRREHENVLSQKDQSIEASNRLNVELESTITGLNTEIAGLRSHVASDVERLRQGEDGRSANAMLESTKAELANVKNELEALKGDLLSVTRTNDDRADKITDQASEIKRLQERNNGIETRLTQSLREEIDGLNVQLQDIKKSKKELLDKVNEHEKSKEEYQTAIADKQRLSNELESSKSLVSELKSTNSELTTKHDNQTRELVSLKSKQAELVTAKSDLDLSKQQVAILTPFENLYAIAQGQILAKDAEIIKSTRERDEAKNELALCQCTSHVETIAQLQTQLAARDTTIKQLHEDLSKRAPLTTPTEPYRELWQRESLRANTLDSDFQSLQDQTQNMRQAQLQAQLRAGKDLELHQQHLKTASELQKKCLKLGNANDTLELRLEDAQTGMETLESSVKNLEDTKLRLMTESSVLRENYHLLVTANVELKNKVDRATTLASEESSSRAELTSKLTKAERAVRSLRSEKLELEESIKLLEEEIKGCRQRQTDATTEASRQRELIFTLQDAEEQLKRDIKRQEESMKTTSTKMNDLQKKVDDLTVAGSESTQSREAAEAQAKNANDLKKAAEAKATELLSQLKTLTDEKQTLLDEKQTLLDEKQTLLDEKQTLLDEKQTLLRTSKFEQERTQNLLNGSTEREGTWKRESEELQKQLRRSMNDYLDANRKFTRLKQEHEQLVITKDRYVSELKEKSDRVDKAELNKAQAEARENLLKGRCETLENYNKDAEMALKRMQEDLDKGKRFVVKLQKQWKNKLAVTTDHMQRVITQLEQRIAKEHQLYERLEEHAKGLKQPLREALGEDKIRVG